MSRRELKNLDKFPVLSSRTRPSRSSSPERSSQTPSAPTQLIRLPDEEESLIPSTEPIQPHFEAEPQAIKSESEDEEPRFSTPPNSPTPPDTREMEAKMDLLMKEMATLKNTVTALQTENQTLRGGHNSQAAREGSVASSAGGGSSKRTAKVNHPEKLVDGVTGIKFVDWKTGVRDVLEINHDHYESDAARMQLVHSLTDPNGLARAHLRPRYSSDAEDRFATADQMLELLTTCFLDPNEQRRAKTKFDAMNQDFNPDPEVHIKKYASFDAFKADFIITATTAKIPKDSWFDSIFEKTSFFLQKQISVTLPFHDNDFNKLCIFISKTELENARIHVAEENHKALAIAKAGAKRRKMVNFEEQKAKTIPSEKPKELSTPKHFIGPASSDSNSHPHITCHNCGKKGHYASTCTEPQREKGTGISLMDEDEQSLIDMEDSENSSA